MRLLIQRVREASVTIGGVCCSRIGAGLLVFVGVGTEDTDEDLEYLAGKLVRLRIFDDEAGVMNLDLLQTGGEVLVVSQFTLQASTRKGNRPSYIHAAPEPVSRPLYERFVERVAALVGKSVATGRSAPTCRWRWSMTGPSRSGWTRKTGIDRIFYFTVS